MSCRTGFESRLRYFDLGLCRSDSQNDVCGYLAARRNGMILNDCNLKGGSNGSELITAHGNSVEGEAARAVGHGGPLVARSGVQGFYLHSWDNCAGLILHYSRNAASSGGVFLYAGNRLAQYRACRPQQADGWQQSHPQLGFHNFSSWSENTKRRGQRRPCRSHPRSTTDCQARGEGGPRFG